MINRITLLVFISVIWANISIAGVICSGSTKAQQLSGADELKMLESDFSFQHAMLSIQFLENDVIEILKNHKGSHPVLEHEGFYIGYPNKIAFIKGALLKQEVLIAKMKFELEKLKLRNGLGSKNKVTKAEKNYFQSRDAFCEFLKGVKFVD